MRSLTKSMRRGLLRGFCTISSICGRQNLTWSFRTSSISRYFLTWGGRTAGEEPTFLRHIAPRGDASPKAVGSLPHDGIWGGNRAHLVEDEGLADVAPRAAGREVVEGEEEEEEEAQARRGRDGADEEHHDAAAGDAQQARVPAEVAEGGPGAGRKGHGLGTSCAESIWERA